MEAPGFLRGMLEKNGGGYHEYLVFRTQLGTVALFLFSVFLAFQFSLLLMAAVSVLFLLNARSVFFEMKDFRNASAYKYFFGGLSVFGLALAFSNLVVRSFDPVFALSYLGSLAVFLLVFHLKFRKNFVFGEVLLADKDWAVVRVPYDLPSGTKNGFYAVKSRKGVKKGDEVKIDLAHSFGERRMPWRVTD